MRITDQLLLTARILHWRLTWSRRDLGYRPRGALDARFMTARDAARLMPDGACCLSTGMAGNARCSTLFWAIRENFRKSGRPRGLTWIAVGGQGGRGRAPGTVEELGLAGLLNCFISGHVETTKALLALAQAGELELHVMPQGEMCLALEAQARGDADASILSRTAIGTVLDPRCGRGSAVTPGASESFIECEGEMLRFRLPKLDVAVIAAPWADAAGNIYLHDAATLTEIHDAAHAAKRNGGQVLVSVAGVIPSDPERIGLPAAMVDAVVVNPRQEQTILSRQRACWRAFTIGGDGDDKAAIEKLRFINRFLRLTPVRGPVECALARLGAHVFARAASRREPRAHGKLGVDVPALSRSSRCNRARLSRGGRGGQRECLQARPAIDRLCRPRRAAKHHGQRKNLPLRRHLHAGNHHAGPGGRTGYPAELRGAVRVAARWPDRSASLRIERVRLRPGLGRRRTALMGCV
jgi:propionate CoA-transferase